MKQFAIKLDLEYYGLATLDFIKFVDELPCILEYVEGSFETDENITLEVSEDGKTLFFNVSDDIELEQGESIANNPQIGRIVPEIMQTNFREIMAKKYRIVYRIENDRIAWR